MARLRILKQKPLLYKAYERQLAIIMPTDLRDKPGAQSMMHIGELAAGSGMIQCPPRGSRNWAEI